MKRKLSVLLACSLAAASFASAETTPQSTAAAKELVKTMKLTEQINTAMGSAGGMADAMIAAQNLPPETAARAKAAAQASMLAAMESMRKIDWETIVSEIYAEELAVEDIKAITAFYQSPAGQHLLEKQPALSAAMMKRMQGEMAKIMPEVQKKVAEAIESAKKAE